MPHKDPEKRREYARLYYEQNKERLSEQSKKYREENKKKK